jgi:hypothetical protein
MKTKSKEPKAVITSANFKIQGSALVVRDQLVKNPQKKMAKHGGPGFACGCC